MKQANSQRIPVGDGVVTDMEGLEPDKGVETV